MKTTITLARSLFVWCSDPFFSDTVTSEVLTRRLNEAGDVIARDAIADALLAYLDTGAAPGTITLESTFVAGERE